MASTPLIDRTSDTMYVCMYRVATLVFSVADKKISLNQSNVLSVEKIDYFDYKLRSILKVRLAIDIRQKLWILANKSDVICKFELNKFGMDTDIEAEIVGDQNVWNQEFAVYLNDDDAAIDIEGLEDELKLNSGQDFTISDTDDRDYFNGQEILDVYLYNASLLKPSTFRLDGIYKSDILSNIMGNIITKSKHKHVLMSPIENNTVYKELELPSYKAYEAFVYLDQYYGLYKAGASIFYDVDRLYIINANGKSTAVADKEWPETNFLVSQKSNSNPGNGMVYRQKEKTYYINIPEDNIQPNKPSDSTKITYGDSVQIITTDDIKIDTIGNSSNSQIAYMRSTDNQFAAEVIEARMRENDCIMYINGDGFDINAFTLNKTFKITYEDPGKQKKYGKHRYRIAFAQHALQIQTNSYMKSSHMIILKKCS